MRLLWSPRSPYVRKVTMVAHETGLIDRIALVARPASFTTSPSAELLAANPLGKIPALLLDDGEAIYDSAVICAYLDSLHDGPHLLPPGAAGVRCLRWQALGDGILERLTALQVEHRRPEGPWIAICEAAEAKLTASLDAARRDLGDLLRTEFGLAHIAMIAALGHLDFRFAASGWRAAWPELAAWFDEQGQRPSVSATAPADEPGAPAHVPLSALRFRR